MQRFMQRMVMARLAITVSVGLIIGVAVLLGQAAAAPTARSSAGTDSSAVPKERRPLRDRET